MSTTKREMDKNAPTSTKMVQIEAHVWSKSYDPYALHDVHHHEPYHWLDYQDDCRNEVYYSILNDQDIDEVMLQIKRGAMIDVDILLHLDDGHSEELIRILKLGALQDDSKFTNTPTAAYLHYDRFSNEKMAEILVLHLFDLGLGVEDIKQGIYDNFYSYDESELDQSDRDVFHFSEFLDQLAIRHRYESLKKGMAVPNFTSKDKKTKL